jgi:hypothetical protein
MTPRFAIRSQSYKTFFFFVIDGGIRKAKVLISLWQVFLRLIYL